MGRISDDDAETEAADEADAAAEGEGDAASGDAMKDREGIGTIAEEDDKAETHSAGAEKL